MKAIVVFGGNISEPEFYRRLISGHDFIIGADKGNQVIRGLGFVPDLAVGDFDSISPAALEWLERGGVPLRRFPVDKDRTDGQLAVEAAIEAGASSLTLTAAWGGRIDHSLGNLFLLGRAEAEGVPCRLVESDCEITLVTAGTEALPADGYVEIEGRPGDIVSLVPLRTCVGLTLEGLKYPAADITIEPGSTQGLSNLLINGRAKIKMVSGQILLIRTRPREGHEARS